MTLRWGHVEWGGILLVCAVAVWIYERVFLRTAVRLQDVELVSEGVEMTLTFNAMLVVGSLYVIVNRQTLRRRPRIWAAAVAGLWGAAKLALFLYLWVRPAAG